MSNYAKTTDLQNVTHVDTSSFAPKTNLTNLKTELDKSHIDKLAPVPVDLSKLSNVVKNNAAKRTVYDKLVAKVNNIDTSDFLLKTKYNTNKTELEKKILDVSNLVEKTKLTELENKLHDIGNLATKAALTAVENKIPSVSNLVYKTNSNTKITEIENILTNHNHDKYTDTPEFNKSAADGFNARLAQANLITTTDFDAKLSSLNRKVTKNKPENLIVKNELNRLHTFDSSSLIGKSYFDEDGAQSYLVFQAINIF